MGARRGYSNVRFCRMVCAVARADLPHSARQRERICP
jgi:hypothetical protein